MLRAPGVKCLSLTRFRERGFFTVTENPLVDLLELFIQLVEDEVQVFQMSARHSLPFLRANLVYLLPMFQGSFRITVFLRLHRGESLPLVFVLRCHLDRRSAAFLPHVIL